MRDCLILDLVRSAAELICACGNFVYDTSVALPAPFFQGERILEIKLGPDGHIYCLFRRPNRGRGNKRKRRPCLRRRFHRPVRHNEVPFPRAVTRTNITLHTNSNNR
jgi:hypothetical protein